MGSYSRTSPPKESGPFGAVPPSEPWPDGHAAAGFPPAIDDLLRTDASEPTTEDSVRSVLLAKAVEYEIIPRLMLAHRVPQECASFPVAGNQRISAEDVAVFAELVLHEDDAAISACVIALRDRGVPVESIFMDLLAPVARHLGEMWERDLCTFTEVTVGLGRLQQVLRENSATFAQFNGATSTLEGRRLLLMPCPGEQHTFGLSMVGEIFHRAGWDVVTNFLSSHAAPAMVEKDWYDVVGFSLGCETGIARLQEVMALVRRKSQNPRVSIIAGGAIFALHPEYGNQIPADAIVTDGPRAPALAEKLVNDRHQRS
ncbi:MAG: B12-binding domain-containing protein [Hydrogenophaga sp.]|uniref:cobalamin B12-binding domain-containing protein n=1 Tax=Hydrogenophaga sp. TaxID=1904254 RepID=UPI003D14F3DF